ncbi:MAG TPA: zinc ribbon domain-containing protein [Phycisphaerae bacterium]|nr:zinc ribbon domain-containing protein [Phycisphaerae bacterium]
MSNERSAVHPHDQGLPKSVVRKRKRFRRIAYIMLLITIVTAVPGWFLFGASLWNAFSINGVTVIQGAIAYTLLIVSSVTLVLGLWYLLLAQARRVAHMVEGPGESEASVPPRICTNCGWAYDATDRFCRHCGKMVEKTAGENS